MRNKKRDAPRKKELHFATPQEFKKKSLTAWVHVTNHKQIPKTQITELYNARIQQESPKTCSSIPGVPSHELRLGSFGPR